MRKYPIAEVAEKTAETPKQGCIHRTTGLEPDILALSADLLSDLCAQGYRSRMKSAIPV